MDAPRGVSNSPSPVENFDINRAVSPQNRHRFAKWMNGIDVTTYTLSLYREKFFKGGSQFWDQSMFSAKNTKMECVILDDNWTHNFKSFKLTSGCCVFYM